MKTRCSWVSNDPLYQRYHDEEWGVPVREDDKMFEFLLLESFQAGLSWLTILRKRENFRSAFEDFDYRRIARYGDAKFEALMKDAGIIRNRQKIQAAIHNAGRYVEVQREFGSFCQYLWAFVDHQPLQPRLEPGKDLPATTALSDQISKDLKNRGFKFLGSTTIYAHMQACGMTNDHTSNCFRYEQLK